MWPRLPSKACIVPNVVSQLPGMPRLLQWMCTGCGSPSSAAACATPAMICRGVTSKCSTSLDALRSRQSVARSRRWRERVFFMSLADDAVESVRELRPRASQNESLGVELDTDQCRIVVRQ